VEGLALRSVAAADLAVRRGCHSSLATTPELIAAAYAAVDHLRIDGRPAQAWAPMSGFVEAADGWVRLHGNYPHHAAAITAALGASTRAELSDAVRVLPAHQVEDRVGAAGGIATVVRSEREWAAHPHGAATAQDPWHTVEPGSARAALPPSGEPLAGVRVLDLTRVIAGPTCSQLLGCLGADVLRIDPPQRPELLDQYLSNGMGKRSAEADLATHLNEVRTELLPRADVVLLGYRPGALARFGLDPESLRADHPGLVVASLSAWGEHGSWGGRAGFDSIVQAASGIATVCAGDDERPGALPVQALDHSTGYVLAAEVMSLLSRGLGGTVRGSLLGAARVLLTEYRSANADPVDLDVPTLEVDTPHGRLLTVPPPVTVGGRTISRPIGAYGAAPLRWFS
jgi:crotonobetainyl-CoA:carnitine CoA-transferase CaiB-like acyl-CoA transferase